FVDVPEILIADIQLGEGPIATSNIPTTSAVTTRVADKVLSKRPLAVFNKNSFFVKTAEWPSVWFGNGIDNLTINGKNLVRSSNSGDIFSEYNQSIITKTINLNVPEWGATDATHIFSPG